MILLGVMFVSLAAMAIALGVSLGTGGRGSENTAVPSAKPSLPPTVCPAMFCFLNLCIIHFANLLFDVSLPTVIHLFLVS